MLILGLFLISFTLSWVTVGVIKSRFSQQFLDIPNERSAHSQPTPRGGGLGFVIAFGISSWLEVIAQIYFPEQMPDWFVESQTIFSDLAIIWLSLIPLIIIGILDDRSEVPAKIRYLVQLGSSLLIIAYFGPFAFPALQDWGTIGYILEFILTIIGMTSLINFYNFMDGLDGLVAGVTAIQLSFLALWFGHFHLLFLVAALVGFLRWNWSPAKIFMGDVGSTILGAMIAIALLNNQGNLNQNWLAVPILMPVIGDTIYTITRRLRCRENIFQAHRSHLYQRLQQSGWSHPQVAITYISLAVVIAFSLNYGLNGWIVVISSIGLILITEGYLASRSGAEKSQILKEQ